MEFTVTPVQLQELVRHKKVEELVALGGLEGLAEKLGTHLKTGLSKEEVDSNFAHRRSVFGINVLPEPKHKNFFQLWFEAIKDLTLIILIIAAVVSLVLGLAIPEDLGYQDACLVNVTYSEDEVISDQQSSWIEGAAILAAVLVASTVTAGNNYSKERQFRALSNQEERDRTVKVIRKGELETIPYAEVNVGDVIALDTGDEVPADSVYISGFGMKVDSSKMTGETTDMKINASRPFVHLGYKLTDGSGYVLACGVGQHTEWGKTMESLHDEKPDTPLQENLDVLAGTIGKFGMSVALFVFIFLSLWWLIPALTYECEWVYADDYCAPAPTNISSYGSEYVCPSYDWSQAVDLIDYVIIAITIVVVAVPEGLPLAVTISLAYSMKQMYADKNLVRHLKACETMSNCTNICSDKTGTLTENCMTIVRGWLSGRDFPEVPPKFEIPKHVLRLTTENCALNCAYSSNLLHKEGKPVETVGNKTDCAFLIFSEALGANYHEIRDQNSDNIYQRFTFSSTRKRSNCLVWLDQSKGLIRHYVKGAAEIVLRRCASVLDAEGNPAELSDELRAKIEEEIQGYATKGLRPLCLAFRDHLAADPSKAIEVTPKEGSSSADQHQEGETETIEDAFSTAEPNVVMDDTKAVYETAPDTNLTLYAILGIHDPLRPEVPAAVRACQDAGITVRMVTGDNLLTAEHIARDCFILKPGGLAIEGPEFASMSKKQQIEILPKLQVLARSSPTDKKNLVKRLIKQGEVVAVTGDGTNDVQALKKADVGLAMGLRGTDIAKQAADIVILDDNFKSIVKSVMWGRSVYDNIRKFIQFQLTVNVVALAVVAIGAVTQKGACLKAIQLLWVNMIMDTMAALALGTEQPTAALLKRKPFGRYDRLISNYMIRNIAVHATYQLAVLLTLLYAGRFFPWLSVDCAYTDVNDPLSTTLTSTCCLENSEGVVYPSDTYCPDGEHRAFDSEINEQTVVLQTVIFNTFVFCQVFNEVNSRKVNNEWNVWEKIWTNWMFLLIVGITVVIQTLIIVFAGDWMSVAPYPGLNLAQWVTCLVLAVITVPLGLLCTQIPVPAYEPKKFKEDDGPSIWEKCKAKLGFTTPESQVLLPHKDNDKEKEKEKSAEEP
ncbi:plasma membrane calcium-transporting ATPase 3 [Pelomyxa schiedti]|nr:plasma membrane calcium-transporting ATPase 3 [Pelomyxa schiedti]